jgi:predicted Zn-dependent protease
MRNRRPSCPRRATLGFFGAVLLFASLPNLARAEARGVYEALELKERELGLMQAAHENEALFVRRGYRYNSPELEALISRIGAALAPDPTDPYIKYRFHVLRDSEPNAFALPDGQIYVNTGILALLENEAQLAALLGHEVHHTAGHHTILEYRSVRRKMVASMILGGGLIGDIFVVLSVLGYSRDLEEEADGKGIRRMLEAGYDPREAPRLFEIMQGDPEGDRPRASTAWSTHPDLKARADTARAAIPVLTADAGPEGLKIEGRSFRKLIRQTSLDTVQDLIAADRPRSAVDLASRLVGEDEADPARHLALGDAFHALGAVREPAGEEAPTNRDKKRRQRERMKLTREERDAERRAAPEGPKALQVNLKQAQQAYSRALGLDPELAEAHRGLGFVLAGLGSLKEAGREFVVYLRARPEAPDRPIVLARLKEITDEIKKGGNEDATWQQE